ncbi:hypothetical protein LTR66_000629 [Elasticomyces elasticus]|nr:hypothetical protein LTR66_000629 [Elasticomyces elasticus]
MSDPLLSAEAISSTSRECKNYFRRVASRQWSAQFTNSDALQASFADVYGRYKIWGGSIGAFHDYDNLASLDQRLRNARSVAGQIREHLSSLQEDLYDFEAIVTGDRENRQCSLYYDLEGSVSRDGPSVSTERSEDQTLQISEVHEVLMNIEETVSFLLRLSAVIRKFTPRDRFAKASATIEQSSVLSEDFDVKLIGHRNPHLNTADKEWLKVRLGEANNQRRKFLLYCQQHSERLAGKVDVSKEAGTASKAYAIRSTPSIQKDHLASTVDGTKKSEMTKSFVNTTASTFVDDGRIVQAETSDDEVSQVSYLSTSRVGEVGRELSVIPLAQVSKGRAEFQCPYCWIVQTINSERSWQKHVFSDIKAYMCTFKNCELRTFGISRAWYQHEIETHLVEWQCQYCSRPPFEQLQDFKDHMLRRHQHQFTQAQLPALTRVSQQPVDSVSAAVCKFCDWSKRIRDVDKLAPNDQIIHVSLARYQAHVGVHLEQIALAMLKTQFSYSESLSSSENEDTSDIATAQQDADAGLDEGSTTETPLYFAASQGLEAEVMQLMDDGADVNASKHPYHGTPLHGAAENGHLPVVQLLLGTNGVDPDLKDINMRTPLSLAAKNGHEAVVKLLLEPFAKGQLLPSTPEISIEAPDIDGLTPLSLAAHNGHVAVVRLLLGTSEVDPDSKDTNGRTPLSHAAYNGHVAVVRLLLGTSEVDPDSKDTNARTPLSYAAYNGHEAVTRLLLDTGRVDPGSKDTNERTPLSHAAYNGHEAVVEMLLATGVVVADSKDTNGRTPLSHAAYNGHVAVVELLLATRVVDLDSKTNATHQTPLSFAAKNGHEAVVEMLLSTGLVVADSKDTNAQTPLSLAAENGHEAVVKMLLALGTVDSDSKTGSTHQTPLSLAAYNGHKTVVRLLLGRGKADVNLTDSEGQTPLLLGTKNGHEAVVRLLLDRGAELGLEDNRGRTPLFIAVEYGHEAVVRLLLEAGADVDLKNNQGQTPFSIAAEYGHKAIVRLLLETGVDVDSRSDRGETPLSLAVRHGHEPVVRLLLETSQVDMNSKNNRGATPLSYAIHSRQERIVRLLLRTGKVDPAGEKAAVAWLGDAAVRDDLEQAAIKRRGDAASGEISTVSKREQSSKSMQ